MAFRPAIRIKSHENTPLPRKSGPKEELMDMHHKSVPESNAILLLTANQVFPHEAAPLQIPADQHLEFDGMQAEVAKLLLVCYRRQLRSGVVREPYVELHRLCTDMSKIDKDETGSFVALVDDWMAAVRTLRDQSEPATRPPCDNLVEGANPDCCAEYCLHKSVLEKRQWSEVVSHFGQRFIEKFYPLPSILPTSTVHAVRLLERELRRIKGLPSVVESSTIIGLLRARVQKLRDDPDREYGNISELCLDALRATCDIWQRKLDFLVRTHPSEQNCYRNWEATYVRSLNGFTDEESPLRALCASGVCAYLLEALAPSHLSSADRRSCSLRREFLSHRLPVSGATGWNGYRLKDIAIRTPSPSCEKGHRWVTGLGLLSDDVPSLRPFQVVEPPEIPQLVGEDLEYKGAYFVASISDRKEEGYHIGLCRVVDSKDRKAEEHLWDTAALAFLKPRAWLLEQSEDPDASRRINMVDLEPIRNLLEVFALGYKLFSEVSDGMRGFLAGRKPSEVPKTGRITLAVKGDVLVAEHDGETVNALHCDNLVDSLAERELAFYNALKDSLEANHEHWCGLYRKLPHVVDLSHETEYEMRLKQYATAVARDWRMIVDFLKSKGFKIPPEQDAHMDKLISGDDA